MQSRLKSSLFFGVIFTAQAMVSTAFAQKHPLPLLEAQETSPNFIPQEKRYQPQDGKNPNVLSKALLTQLGHDRKLFQKMIDPHLGIWLVTYVTGDFDPGVYSSIQHLCPGTWQKEIPSLLKKWQKRISDVRFYEDESSCHNNVEFPFCSFAVSGEGGTGWDFVFTRNADTNLVFRGILIRTSTYREEFQKQENAYVRRAFDKAQATTCPGELK